MKFETRQKSNPAVLTNTYVLIEDPAQPVILAYIRPACPQQCREPPGPGASVKSFLVAPSPSYSSRPSATILPPSMTRTNGASVPVPGAPRTEVCPSC